MNSFTLAAITATSLAFVTPATAGGLAEPVEMDPIEIVEDTTASSSSSGLIIPLILIALIAAAVSANGGEGSEAVCPQALVAPVCP